MTSPALTHATPARFVRDRGTWLAYLAVGLFAFQQATLGPLMPSLREDLGFGYTLATLHFSAMAVGLVVVWFSGDRLARRWDRGKAFWRGVTGLANSSLVLVTSPVVAGTIAGTFGIGASGSLLGITIQAHLAERQQARRAQAIAELNLATSACAVLASIAICAFERTEIGWRGALLAAAGGLLLVRLVFRHVDIDPAVPAGASHRGDGHRLPGAFWAYAAVIFLGVSVAWCVAFWGTDFLEQSGDLSRANEAAAMSAFFVAILTGGLWGANWRLGWTRQRCCGVRC